LSWFLDQKNTGIGLFFLKEADDMVQIKKNELDCAGLGEMGQAGWPGL
jgi:hypothetical protein